MQPIPDFENLKHQGVIIYLIEIFKVRISLLQLCIGIQP